MRGDRRSLGAAGEAFACDYLRDSGYTILERNWRCRRGELDIVTRRGGTTVFVEVKARTGSSFGEPEEAVTRAKARRIRALAAEYLAGAPPCGVVRFDVIAVKLDPDGDLLELNHLRDAF